MKPTHPKIACLAIIIILQITFFTGTPSQGTIKSSKQTTVKAYNLPFDNFYLHYYLKGKKDSLTLSNIVLNISYSKLNTTYSSYDYQQKMIISSPLLHFLNENQENATFYENSSTRIINLDSTEGAYIAWLIYHVSSYNSSYGAYNWDPFFIIPQNITETYPIYSFSLNLTSKTVLNPGDMALFNYERPIITYQGIQHVYTSYENITNDINLIYDNYTGILLKGALHSVVIGTSQTNEYYANFELLDTNGFDAFDPYPVPNSTQTSFDIIPPQLQRPNYFLLLVILALPIIITVIRFLSLKEISGGTE